MRVSRISDIKWNNSLSISASEGYLSSTSKNYGWLCDHDEGMFIPFAIFNRRHLFSELVFTDDICYIIKDEKCPSERKKEFLAACVEYVKRKLKVDNIIQQPAFAAFEIAPTGATAVPFGSYRIDLTQSHDNLWKNVHSKHKNVIRKAEKSGVIVKSGIEYLNAAVDLVSATLRRSNIKPLDLNYITRLSGKLQGHILPYVCEYKGEYQGSAIYLFSGKSALYLWGGSLQEPFTGSINYMHWNAILDFKNRNVRCYDFVGARIKPAEGSKLEGIQRFKSRFGGPMYQGYLWKYPLSWKCLHYNNLKKIYFKMKGINSKDIIDQELQCQ